MQLRREKHSLTKQDKNKDFGKLKRKLKQEDTLFRVSLWKAVSVVRFWKCWGCRSGFCGQMEQGVVEERVIQTWTGISPEGLCSMGTHSWSTGGVRSRERHRGIAAPWPRPFALSFHWRHWVWPLAVVPRRRTGTCCDAQPYMSP